MKQYTVTGMSCAACQARVEKAVSAVDGVTACSVSLLTNSMGVEGNASDGDIIKAVQNGVRNGIRGTGCNTPKKRCLSLVFFQVHIKFLEFFCF